MSSPSPLQTRSRLPLWAQRALDLAVVPADNLETVRSKRLLTGALLVSIPTSLGSAWSIAFPLGAPGAGAIVAAAAVGSFVVLWVMRARPDSFPGVMHWVAGFNMLISLVLMVTFGGLLPSGLNAIWGVLSVLGAAVIFADRRALVWLAIYVVGVIVAAIWANGADPVFTLANPELQGVFNLLAVVTFVFLILYYYVQQRAQLLRQSDTLLRNVLPDSVADRLKESHDTIAERFESATILFADVADFTPLAAELSPEGLVALLDEVFSEFDRLVEERGLEKIKTIGDAYMVAGGVPEPRADHAHAICDLALAMMRLVEGREFGGHQLRLRMGISSGEVVAGVIGTKKFSYDLWGDAVNTASRMEANGVPGKIQITEATCRLVGDAFGCEPRGTVDVKGKGPMEVWFLVGRR